MIQSYEDTINHLKSEIQALKDDTKGKDIIIASLSKENAELFEKTITQNKQLEFVQQNQIDKHISDIAICEERLSYLNTLNEELIQKYAIY